MTNEAQIALRILSSCWWGVSKKRLSEMMGKSNIDPILEEIKECVEIDSFGYINLKEW